MKQKVLLLLVLALGMCGTAGFAQEKEYKVGEDGFEWYKVSRTVNGQEKYGAEDRYGNMIVPVEYDFMFYSSDDNPLLTGFKPKKGKFQAWYSKSGKCVIPYSRGYTYIQKWDKDEFGTYYTCEKPDGGSICDRNGREVVSVMVDGLSHISIHSWTNPDNEKVYYFLAFHVKKNGEEYYGHADANGRIIVPAESKLIPWDLAKSRLTTTNNPLAGNRHETLAEAEGRTQGGQNHPAAGQQQQQGGGGKKPIIKDPVPVQQWQACFGCGGMGTMGCDNCGGSGTKYIGNSLYTCSRCNGRGIIPCNMCHGNKGQYVTVYR